MLITCYDFIDSNEEYINNNEDNNSEIRITEFDFVDVNSTSASTSDPAEDENVERKNKNNKTGKKNPKRRWSKWPENVQIVLDVILVCDQI